jgi:hypothetical protein
VGVLVAGGKTSRAPGCRPNFPALSPNDCALVLAAMWHTELKPQSHSTLQHSTRATLVSMSSRRCATQVTRGALPGAGSSPLVLRWLPAGKRSAIQSASWLLPVAAQRRVLQDAAGPSPATSQASDHGALACRLLGGRRGTLAFHNHGSPVWVGGEPFPH